MAMRVPTQSEVMVTRGVGALPKRAPTYATCEPSALAAEWFRRKPDDVLFTADWRRVVFAHYAVKPDALEPYVPFPLDVHEGRAYVSCVAFTLARLRPSRGGRVGALFLQPISEHGFLNVRTYVRVEGERGIYFLAEWLPNRLSVVLGRMAYGLPYRHGELYYAHEHERGRVAGAVVADWGEGCLRYQGAVPGDPVFRACEAGSLDEFLLERYTAWTLRGEVRRRFRIWHEPWPQVAIDPEIEDDSLLCTTGGWYGKAELVGGHYSPGVADVKMGFPWRLATEGEE